ncbi:MAG: MotA/TolQ/ExbB proton channel family protein [Phycisphaerae bacterium]|nr:MotA/TolQ/ExbB proton channel family protein [Phycisphaerae bacterium]
MRSMSLTCLVAIGLYVAGALAQPAGPAAPGAAPAVAAAPPERTSLLNIFFDGIEVPSYFIFLGSFVCIMLIVEHFVTVRHATIAPLEQTRRVRKLIEQRNLRECVDAIQKSGTFFARTMNAALQHAPHGFDAMHEAATEKSGELSGRMYRKVEYLNILGNLGPLLGLLGTVWGMIEAFGSLSNAAGTDAGGLAGGISKALVNTGLGLVLAIIGLAFYGVCRNRIESHTVSATVEVLNMLEYFRPAAQSSFRTAPPPRATAATAASPRPAPPRPGGAAAGGAAPPVGGSPAAAPPSAGA